MNWQEAKAWADSLRAKGVDPRKAWENAGAKHGESLGDITPQQASRIKLSGNGLTLRGTPRKNYGYTRIAHLSEEERREHKRRLWARTHGVVADKDLTLRGTKRQRNGYTRKIQQYGDKAQ